jgi:hypothetical protein
LWNTCVHSRLLEDTCDLLNKYFSLILKLEEENVPLADFDIKTNKVINEVFVTINEIVDILKIIDPSKGCIHVCI